MAIDGGIDPVAVVGGWPGRIAHVHAKDVRTDRHAATLRAIGYAGWIVIEAEQNPAIADPRAYARSGLQSLRRLID